jgi:hypothetical protein
MELQFVIDNRIRRERLPRPVNDMVDEKFNLTVSQENWHIAARLSNLPLCDKRRSVFCRIFNQKRKTCNHLIDEAIIDLINTALIPF